MERPASTIAYRIVCAGREVVLDPAEQPAEADIGYLIAVLVHQFANPVFESGFSVVHTVRKN